MWPIHSFAMHKNPSFKRLCLFVFASVTNDKLLFSICLNGPVTSSWEGGYRVGARQEGEPAEKNSIVDLAGHFDASGLDVPDLEEIRAIYEDGDRADLDNRAKKEEGATALDGFGFTLGTEIEGVNVELGRWYPNGLFSFEIMSIIPGEPGDSGRILSEIDQLSPKFSKIMEAFSSFMPPATGQK